MPGAHPEKPSLRKKPKEVEEPAGDHHHDHQTGQRLFGLRRDQPEMLIDLSKWHIIEVNHILREWFGRHGEPDPTNKLFREFVPAWVEDHEKKEEFAIDQANKGKRTRDVFSSRGSAIYLPIAHTELKCKITTEINVESTMVIVRFVDLSEQAKQIDDLNAQMGVLEAQTKQAEIEARLARDSSRSRLSALVWAIVALVGAYAIAAASMVTVMAMGVVDNATTQDFVTLGLAVTSAVSAIGGFMVGYERGQESKS